MQLVAQQKESVCSYSLYNTNRTIRSEKVTFNLLIQTGYSQLLYKLAFYFLNLQCSYQSLSKIPQTHHLSLTQMIATQRFPSLVRQLEQHPIIGRDNTVVFQMELELTLVISPLLTYNQRMLVITDVQPSTILSTESEYAKLTLTGTCMMVKSSKISNISYTKRRFYADLHTYE